MPDGDCGAPVFVGANEVSEDDVVCGCWLDAKGEWEIGTRQPDEDYGVDSTKRYFAVQRKRMMNKCPSCGCGYERKHKKGCAVERCSMCGSQRILCGCPTHDPKKTKWLGVLPKTD
jgi:hypothetical protein